MKGLDKNHKEEEKEYWYVAKVANNTELSTMSKLEAIGVGFPAEGHADYFVPLHKVDVVNRRGKVVTKDKPAIPGIMFVRTTNEVRYNLTRYPNIKRWMMSTTYGPNGLHKFAIVSDAAMDEFKDMIEKLNGYYSIDDASKAVGKKVRFVKGPLKGMEGVLEEKNGKYTFSREIGEEFIPGITTVIDEETLKKCLDIIS